MSQNMDQKIQFGMTCEGLCTDLETLEKVKEISMEEGTVTREVNELAELILDMTLKAGYNPKMGAKLGDLFAEYAGDPNNSFIDMFNTYGDLYFQYGHKPIIFMEDDDGNVINAVFEYRYESSDDKKE